MLFLDENAAVLFLDEMYLSVDCVTGSLEKAHQVVCLLGIIIYLFSIAPHP